MQRIEIFKVGSHTSMDGVEAEYPEAMLRVAAAGYDPALSKAPICIGHPTTDAPAYGWVEAVDVVNGVMGAWVDDIAPEFEAAVKEGSYRNVSAAFWKPDAPNNPRPGILYLRHVGFLGAMPPAVAGLKTVSFSIGGCDETRAFESSGRPVVFAAAGGVNAAARAAELERKIADMEVSAFCDGLVKDGRLVPVLRANVVAILSSATDTQTVAFAGSEGVQTIGQRKALMQLLASMPRAFTLGQVAFGDAPEGDDAEAGGYSPPEGFATDPSGRALLREAERIVKKDGVPFAEAVRIAAGRRAA